MSEVNSNVVETSNNPGSVITSIRGITGNLSGAASSIKSIFSNITLVTIISIGITVLIVCLAVGFYHYYNKTKEQKQKLGMYEVTIQEVTETLRQQRESYEQVMQLVENQKLEIEDLIAKKQEVKVITRDKITFIKEASIKDPKNASKQALDLTNTTLLDLKKAMQ